MESIWRRLKFYGVGFGIGTIFVVFFFSNRGCTWLPGNRVKNSILDRLLVVSDETTSILEKRGIDKEAIIQALNTGDVNFKESDKNDDSKVYFIEDDGVIYSFTLPYESFMSEVFIDNDTVSPSGTREGVGTIIHYPNDDNMVFADTSKIVTCQQETLGLIEPKKIFSLIKESNKIDFSKTDLSIRPKPEHYLFFTYEGNEIGAKVIWYKSKLNITQFYIPFENDCK